MTSAWAWLRPALAQPEFTTLVKLSVTLFPMLVMADVASAMLKHYGVLSVETSHLFRLSAQPSVAEYLGYVALQMTVFFLLSVSFKLQSALHFTLSVMLQYLMLDDMYGFHETAGHALGRSFFKGEWPVPTDALGELIFAIGVCAFGAAILMRVFRSSTMFQRSLFFALLIPLFSLGVCAVGIDFLHALIPNEDKFGNGIVALMEDGGELLSMLLLMLVAAAQWIALSWMAGLAPGATRA